jgi:hypothetical protein
MSNAIGINSKIKTEVLETTDTNRSLTYRALVEFIKEQFTESTKYELADVQVVRYVNEKYRFNILTKNILELIYKCKTELNNLISSGYNTYFNIYDIVLDSLFNSQNLYLLMHKMLLYKLTDYNNCYFYGKQINSVMKINYNFMRRLGYMEKVKNYISKQSSDGVIICGDFNDTPISYAYSKMKVGLKDAYVSTGFGPGITYHEDLFLFRIDHIFHSPNIKAYQTKVDKVKFSDHYPLRTYLYLDN